MCMGQEYCKKKTLTRGAIIKHLPYSYMTDFRQDIDIISLFMDR